MNLSTHISANLWAAVSGPYEAGNYSHAVLEAMHVVTNVLREKAGIDGDGATLVGQALGGDNPRIRLNSLQTDTERNIQRGMEQILRGMYAAVRNPRSHDALQDAQETADSIIYFVHYILGLLDASSEAFTLEGFWARVVDTEFVESERYAEILLAEVPPLRRGDAMAYIFQNRLSVNLSKRRALTRTLFGQLNEAQINNYFATVSAELRTTSDEASIRTALQLVKAEYWPRLGEAAKLRIEQKLLKEVESGEVLQAGKGKVTNPLGTWAAPLVPHFSTKDYAARLLLSKLQDSDVDDQVYVARFFFKVLPAIITAEPQMEAAVKAISDAVRATAEVRSALLVHVSSFPEAWVARLKAALSDLTDPKNPAVVLPDGTPFLSAPTAEEFDDDIPF